MKKQTLVRAVVLSLIIGFICGAVYSSVKLGRQPGMGQGNHAKPAAQTADDRVSVDLASKIFQMEQYVKENPGDEKAWARLGNMFFDGDQYANAIAAYRKSLEIKPDQIGVITDMGVMYRRNKEPEKAIKAFDEAIALDPFFETAMFNKGIVLLHDLNDVDGGLKVWEDLVKINPMSTAPNGESVDAIIRKMRARQEK